MICLLFDTAADCPLYPLIYRFPCCSRPTQDAARPAHERRPVRTCRHLTSTQTEIRPVESPWNTSTQEPLPPASTKRPVIYIVPFFLDRDPLFVNNPFFQFNFRANIQRINRTVRRQRETSAAEGKSQAVGNLSASSSVQLPVWSTYRSASPQEWKRRASMNSVFWLIGVIVVTLAILSLLGLA